MKLLEKRNANNAKKPPRDDEMTVMGPEPATPTPRSASCVCNHAHHNGYEIPAGDILLSTSFFEYAYAYARWSDSSAQLMAQRLTAPSHARRSQPALRRRHRRQLGQPKPSYVHCPLRGRRRHPRRIPYAAKFPSFGNLSIFPHTNLPHFRGFRRPPRCPTWLLNSRVCSKHLRASSWPK